MYEDDMDLFNMLQVNKLSMLCVWEVYVEKRTAEDEWSDIDSSDSASTDSDMPDLDGYSPPEADPDESKPSSNAVVFEDLAVITVLDRISQNNDLSHLKKLRLSFDFESQWISPLQRNLLHCHN